MGLPFRSRPVLGEHARPTSGDAGAPADEPQIPEEIRRELEELREAEYRFRTLVERIPAVTYTEVPDPSRPETSRNTYTSPQTTEILGFTPQELMDDYDLWYRQIHPDDLDRVLEEEKRVELSDEPFVAEFRMFRKDGRMIWVRDETVFVNDPETGEQFWHGMMVDITAQREAQEQLREAELRYRSLVEALPAVVFIDRMDALSTNIYTSPQTTEMLGYTPEDWLEHDDIWFRLIHPEDRDRVVAAHEYQLEHGGLFDQEYRMITRSGQSIWVRDVAVVVEDDNATPLYSQGFFLDITDRKEALRALEGVLAREQETAERLRAMDGLKNTLLHTLSHDLRNGLTAIIGAASTLEHSERQVSEREQRALLHSVAGRARRMDRLLTDLLDLDRLDRGIVEPNRYPVDIGQLVRNVVRTSGIVARRETEIECTSVTIAVEAAKVERMVENLLANAARHTPEGARVWVRVSDGPRGAQIVVEDDGPGVPEELRDTVFEPFTRGADTASPGGSGIGLSLVARFAELHGGRAWVQDRPGGGASFHVLLPHPANERGGST